MLAKTVITGLTTAALTVGAALIPTGASARGVGPGNWPDWNTPRWPAHVGPDMRPYCVTVPVTYYHHNHVYTRWVERCQ